MDLTKTYPRSVHEKVFGVVQLGRTIDKAKAKAHGDLGDYNYDCPMDVALFEFLGFNGEELLRVVKNAPSDAHIEAYVKPFVERKPAAEIETWNREWVTHKPEGDSWNRFAQVRSTIAPHRTDVTSWADLLDLDEGRTVSRRENATV